MRGTDQQQSHVFSYISPEQRVPRDHPLRPIRTMVDEILKQLSPQFNKMYAKVGRPSIPPEQLLRAQLSMANCYLASHAFAGNDAKPECSSM